MELLGNKFKLMPKEEENQNDEMLQRWRSIEPIPYSKDSDILRELLNELVNKPNIIKINNLCIEPIEYGNGLMNSFIMEFTVRIKG